MSSGQRNRAVVEAEVLHCFRNLQGLLGELGVLPQEASPPPAALVVEGPIVSLQQAAAAIGWREDRLTRAIVRHNEMNPQDPIGWQAGGNRRARWEIPLGRLMRFIQNRPTRVPMQVNAGK